MKKSILVLLTLVPVVAGYLINNVLLLPVIGMIAFYVVPILVLIFWFYLGSQYANTTWKIIPSALIGNAIGIISVLLYVWQFIFETDETRNIVVAGFSQMFSAATPLYLIGRLAILFESQPNYAGRGTMTAMQVIALIVMILVFMFGYIWRKNKNKNDREFS